MKKITVLFILLFSIMVNAQVGVNTTNPDPSSMLDITATNKGVLVPRVSLANVTTTMLDGTNTAATGLLIWNTNATTVGGNGIGFYYFNATQWMPITQIINDDQTIDNFSLSGTTLRLSLENDGQPLQTVNLAPLVGTDDQNLVTPTLTGTTLNLNIENGTGTSIDLAPLQDGTGTDDQIIDNLSLSGTTLRLSLENDGQPLQTVNLASINTDDQNLVTPTLTGTTLNLSIENGTGTSIDLAPLQDGTGTDDQIIDNFSLSGNTLRLSLENDGQPLQTVNLASINTDDQNLVTPTLTGTTLNLNIENGTGTSIDLAPLQDGTGTDNQTIDVLSLTGETLNISLQNDGVPTQTLNLTSLKNTLDQAYDQGGLGAGRTILATDGAVNIGGEDGLQVTGTFGTGDAILLTGVGTRMFFNPRKAAFRAGRVIGTEWNNANVGDYSAAFGVGNIASGSSSAVFGSSNIVSANNSVAFGNNNSAAGFSSIVFGELNSTNGAFSIAAGTSATASGETSFALGQNVNALGDLSIAFGSASTANVSNGVVIGNNIQSFSPYETVIGTNSTNYTPISTTAFNANDRLFAIGNGINPTNRSNALTIYKDGRMNINDAYTLPTSDGTANQVMQTDGAGNVSWSDISSSNTFSNGLTETAGNVTLGGSLTENTTILNNNFNAIYNLNGTGDFIVQDNGTTAFQVNDLGNVGIGVAPTGSKLDVQGTGFVGNFLNTSVSGSRILNVRHTNTDPGDLGYVNFFRWTNTASGAINGSFTGSGIVYTTVSDRRLKKNIETISEPLNLINQIQPKIYEYKSKPGIKEYGFIAQELKEVYPQAVSGTPDSDVETNPMMVDYSRLTPLLTAGIQELNEEIEKLKQHNIVLENRLTALENENTVLKSALEKINALEVKLDQMNIK